MAEDPIKVILEKCVGCKMCVKACPFGAITMVEKKAVIELTKCTLCGACVKACKDQSGNPQGPCLMTNKLGFGVNLAFRDVKPNEAGKDLLDLTFYPNVDGKRPTPAKTKKTRRS